MDEKNANEKTGEAVEKLTEAVRESYEAAAESAASVRARNARLAQSFLGGGAEVLKAQAELNQQTLEDLAKLAREQQEAFRQLSRESLDAYDGFLDSLFSYYKGVFEEPEDPGGPPPPKAP